MRRSRKGWTLPLFVEPMTLERAWELVALAPLDARWNSRYKRCADRCCHAPDARGHGPYWSVYVNGKRYLVGTAIKRAEVERAWDMIRPIVAQATATDPTAPETIALRLRAGCPRPRLKPGPKPKPRPVAIAPPPPASKPGKRRRGSVAAVVVPILEGAEVVRRARAGGGRK